MASQNISETSAHGRASRATSVTTGKASLAIELHGAVVAIGDTHPLDAGARARHWLRLFSAANAALLRITALVGRLCADGETGVTLPI